MNYLHVIEAAALHIALTLAFTGFMLALGHAMHGLVRLSRRIFG